MLEYLNISIEVPELLNQCYRVLARGWCVRIVVPVGLNIINAYLTDNWFDV
jgi:predicted SAM-dependent methyltransferase